MKGGESKGAIAKEFIEYMRGAANEQMGRSLYASALSNYPVLSGHPMQFQYTPKQNGAGLEFWPAGEPGEPGWERPKGFDLRKPGVEIFDKQVAAKDVMGDVASHYLNQGADPTVTQAYEGFKKSLTDKQKMILQEQYQYAQKNFNEKRPYGEWEKTAGLPAAFRGYAFNQWPSDFNDMFYTQDQRRAFDALNTYLRGGR